MRRGVVALVVIASGVVTALALAQVPTTPSAGHSVAQGILAKAELPPGAVAAASDPSGGLLPGAPHPATPNLIDLRRFWRVPGDPAAVFDWIKAHPPAGANSSFTGTGGDRAGVTARWIGFSFGRPWAMLVFGVAAARGGGTALRVDAQVVWVLLRSPSERIPAGASSIAVTERGLDGHPSGNWTVADPERVKRAAKLIDRLPAAQPGATACANDSGPYVTLAFLSKSGADLATAVVDGSGCLGVTLSIHGRQQHPLDGNPRLVGELSKALGLSL
jgi:hypothetical protein